MGSGHWFRAIIGFKKVKKDKSKQGKVHSTPEKSNGSNEGYQSASEASNHADGSSPTNSGFPIISAEERAAIQIQKAFRAYRARKSILRLRSTGRFNILIQDHSVQKQTSNTLSHLHSWCNIQTQIRNRRLCMVTEGRIKQKKLETQLKLEAKLHELEVEWHNGSETMEEILSRIQQREEAALKRERAMAYAFSHQWRANSSQYLGQAYYTICKENWGWSWIERWIAARPWEVRVNAKQPTNKIKAKQVSNADKVSGQPDLKVSAVSATPASSNGNKTTKAKKSPHHTPENQAIQAD